MSSNSDILLENAYFLSGMQQDPSPIWQLRFLIPLAYTTQFVFIVINLHRKFKFVIRIVIFVTRLVNCSVVPFVLRLFIYMNIYHEYLC